MNMPHNKTDIDNKEKGSGKGILVVGAGISGITTAIEAAETGYRVILIERLPYLGGRAIEMNQYFPKLCPPYCGMEINFRRIKQNSRITLFTSTTVKDISGIEGNYQVTLETQPIYINQNCTLCDECVKVCPVERPDRYNYGLKKTKAVYYPHELAFPARYFIDTNYCLKENCQKCEEVCSYQAIDLKQTGKIMKIEVGSVIFATGWKPFDASLLKDLNYGNHPDIVTNMEMERIAAPNGPFEGKVFCPSDGKKPENITFVQCAGSRDENYLPYCSAVCCSASLKQAINMAEKYPDIRIKIFYIDLRVSGRNEDFLRKAEKSTQITLIKGKVAAISFSEKRKGLNLIAEDIMSGKKKEYITDMVVLATGMVPNNQDNNFIDKTDEGFFEPSDSLNGIYSAGCSKRPMDISSSVKDATGIALKAIQSVRQK